MEAILIPSSPDQSFSPYKQIRNPKTNTRHFISRPSENFAPPSNIIHRGLLFAPPPSLSFSFPPSQQPPLLPLPITRPYISLPSRTRGLSCSPPTNKKFNRHPKKSKTSTSPKKEDTKQDLKSPKEVSESLVIASTNRLGPDPEDLPKDVSRVLSSSSSGNSVMTTVVLGDLEKFSGSVFTLSPPPSSLPLPKFSIRPKLSCNAEAAEIDAGATDNLRRLLRLR